MRYSCLILLALSIPALAGPPPAPKPKRLGVLISHSQRSTDGEPAEITATGQQLAKALEARGFVTLTDPETAAAAELVVHGTVTVVGSTPQRATASYSVSVLDSASGEQLSLLAGPLGAEDLVPAEGGMHLSPKRLASLAGEISDLASGRHTGPRAIELLVVNLANAAAADKFGKALKAIPGVTSVKRLSFKDGTAKLTLQWVGDAGALAKQVALRTEAKSVSATVDTLQVSF